MAVLAVVAGAFFVRTRHAKRDAVASVAKGFGRAGSAPREVESFLQPWAHEVVHLGHDQRAAGAGQTADENGRVARRSQDTRSQQTGKPAQRKPLASAVQGGLEVMSIEFGGESAEYKLSKAMWDQAQIERERERETGRIQGFQRQSDGKGWLT